MPATQTSFSSSNPPQAPLVVQPWAISATKLIVRGYKIDALYPATKPHWRFAAYFENRAVHELLLDLWVMTGNGTPIVERRPEHLVADFPLILSRYTEFIEANKHRPRGDVVIENLSSTIEQLEGPYAYGAYYAVVHLTDFGSCILTTWCTKPLCFGGGFPTSHNGINDRVRRNKIAVTNWYVANKDKLFWSKLWNAVSVKGVDIPPALDIASPDDFESQR